MNTATKVTVAVAGGYVLGRRRKARMAIILASWLIGRRLNLDIKQLGRDAVEQLAASPEVAKLITSLREGLLQSGRGAAMSALNRQMEQLADRLHERTTLLQSGGQKPEQTGEEDEQQAGEDVQPDDEDTATSGKRPAPRRTTRSAASRKAPRGPSDSGTDAQETKRSSRSSTRKSTTRRRRD